MKIGETINFGSYYQSNDSTKEPIEWIVLDINEDAALVISKYILDFKSFSGGSFISGSKTWSSCNIRKWMNTEFEEIIFSESERKSIKVSKTITKDLLFDKCGFIDDYSEDQEDEYEEESYDECFDKMFLLSADEANKYFKSDDERKGFSTLYASAKCGTKRPDQPCWWLLRSLAYERILVSYVDSSGYVNRGGTFMNQPEGIRPAMWISLS